MKGMNKVLFVLISFFFGFVFDLGFVKAANVTNDFTGYYWCRTNDISVHEWSGEFNYYYVDGEDAYCLEASKKEGGPLQIGDFNLTGIPDEIKDRVLLIAYYGYNYRYHQTLEYRAATQALLWETIEGNGTTVRFFTERFGSGTELDISKQKQEIERLISNHYVVPSFTNKEYTVQVGKTLEFHDDNDVLREYMAKSRYFDRSSTSNLFTLKSNRSGYREITFIRKNDYSSDYKIFIGDVYQNMIIPGNVEPVTSIMKINSYKTEVEITKHDIETNTVQGDATFKNAYYGAYSKDSNALVDFSLLDENGKGTFELPYGDYYIKEITPPKGYLLDDAVYNLDARDLEEASLDVYERVIKGKIGLIKYDSLSNACISSGQAVLVGAKYQILDNNDNVVDTLIIGDDCTALSKDLPYGTYKIKEVEAPVGYEKDNQVYMIDVTNNGETNYVNVLEYVIKGKIRLTKYDSLSNACISSGQAILVGAKYQILDNNDNVVDTLIIGDDCTALSKDLPYGTYKIKEVEAPVGYEKDNQVYMVDVTNNGETNIEVLEDIIQNKITLLKQYKPLENNDNFLVGEKQITFEIYDDKNNKFSEIVTDENGYASINLPYGIWKFHQVNTLSGYEKTSDFDVVVSKDSLRNQYYNVLNKRISAYLKVIKIDSATKKTIEMENTSFKILNTDTNEYVKQYVGGEYVDTFYTNEKGIMTTYLKIPSGNYKLIEISSPKGYLINEDGLNFTIDENTMFDNSDNGLVLTLEFENKPIKGRLKLSKMGEKNVINDGILYYETVPLEGVRFRIYASEDIYSSDDTNLYYAKGKVVDTLVTDKDGQAISINLPFGKYYVVETRELDGYISNNEKHYFEINNDNLEENYELLNELKKGRLEITKEDYQNHKGIPNTVMEVYTENDELIFTGTTDEKGKIKVDKMPIGKYYVIEKQAADGYILTTEKYEFEIVRSKQAIKMTITNEKISGNIKIHKVDENNNALSNVYIGIYDINDNLIYEGITDENGYIETNLEYGKYYYKEIETVDGFILSEEKVFFDIEENDKVLEFTLVNKFEKIDVPNTEKNSTGVFDIILYILLLGNLILYGSKEI